MQIDVKRLRKILGWLAIALPWIVSLLAIIYYRLMPESISDTYYLDACITPFMGILMSCSFLLLSYKGYEKIDDIVTSIAAILGICICLFPCMNDYINVVGTFQIPVIISSWIHNISAILFFLLLAYNSFFLFTKTSGEMTLKKKIRNIIYRICGIGIVLSFLIIFIPVSFNIWLMEVFILTFFGLSWLTKSQVHKWLFAD